MKEKGAEIFVEMLIDLVRRRLLGPIRYTESELISDFRTTEKDRGCWGWPAGSVNRVWVCDAVRF